MPVTVHPAPANGTSQAGVLADRPAASAANAGHFYFATDEDGGTLYRSNGSSWVQVSASVLTDEVLVRKAATQTVNNSATFQNDDELLFPVLSGQVWEWEATLLLQGASTTADFKYNWNAPAPASNAGGLYGTLTGNVSGATGSSGDLPTSTRTMNNATGLALGAFSGITLVRTWGQATMNADGNVQLQWAQNTATAEDVSVMAASSLRARRIA